MLARAAARLSPSVTLGEGKLLPVRSSGVDRVIAVWIIDDVANPDLVFQEAARACGPVERW